MKPILLDLFCGAGGAAMGYHRAGFEVVGVDIRFQPNYPFEFHQADALDVLDEIPHPFDTMEIHAIHASPPCQAYTEHNGSRDDHPELIAPTRALLAQTGLPYVIENVSGARQHLRSPFKLCGTSFGLGATVYTNRPVLPASHHRELRRHRYFETNWPVGLLPQCHHRWPACGIYGDHFRLGRRSYMGELSGPQGLKAGSEAMGIDWMTWDELKEAIPPAYTEFIGEQMIRQVRIAA